MENRREPSLGSVHGFSASPSWGSGFLRADKHVGHVPILSDEHWVVVGHVVRPWTCPVPVLWHKASFRKVDFLGLPF